MESSPSVGSRADLTRQQLLQTATELFSLHGYTEVSNRKIADLAGVNQALIGYHFGSKQGLYLAVFDEMVLHLKTRMQAPLEKIHSALSTTNSAEQMIELVCQLLSGYTRVILSADVEQYARLIMREQLAPSEAFERLWQGLGPILELLAQLLSNIQAHPQITESDRLLSLSLIGQALVFRAAQATSNRHLGWHEALTEQQVEQIEQLVLTNTRTLLAL